MAQCLSLNTHWSGILSTKKTIFSRGKVAYENNWSSIHMEQNLNFKNYLLYDVTVLFLVHCIIAVNVHVSTVASCTTSRPVSVLSTTGLPEQLLQKHSFSTLSVK